jgi:hypothetical protein
MEERVKLFRHVIIEFSKSGVLENLILIGGWAQILYREYFGNPPEISSLRTADIDFLIPNPPKIKKEVNLPKLLQNLGFEQLTSFTTGYTKYSHQDLEVEFLIPELGKGKDKPYEIKNLHINAQGLRYLNLLQNNILQIVYNGIPITVPEPSAFVLHKFILAQIRKNEAKSKKDLRVAVELGEFLIQNFEQKEKMVKIFEGLPKSWKKKTLKASKQSSKVIYNELN